MFLQLAHTKLDAYQVSQELEMERYKATVIFPKEERFGMIQQTRRAALSVHLNLAEGCSRKSKSERVRFFEIARASLIEIDTAIGIAYKLTYASLEKLQPLGESIIKTFKLLSGMIR